MYVWLVGDGGDLAIAFFLDPLLVFQLLFVASSE